MCVWIVCCLIMTLCFIPAYAQSRQGQRLEGISYQEFAEWQTRYGGVSGCYPVPSPAYMPGSASDVSEVPCKPIRKKNRTGRK